MKDFAVSLDVIERWPPIYSADELNPVLASTSNMGLCVSPKKPAANTLLSLMVIFNGLFFWFYFSLSLGLASINSRHSTMVPSLR